MMKKFYAISIAGVLIFIPIQFSYAATPKAGSACSKLNIKQTFAGKIFTCTKVGKKLVWNQGVAVPAPAPKVPAATPSTPTSTATETPQSVPSKAPFKAKIPITLPVPQSGTITFANATSSISQIPQVAWQNIQDVIAKNSLVDIPTTLVIGPNTGTTSEIVLGLLKKEYTLWQGFQQPPSFAALIHNAKDEAWSEIEWPKFASTLGLSGFNPSDFLGTLRSGCGFDSSNVATDCWGGSAVVFPNTDIGFAFYGVQEPFWSANSDQAGPISQVTHEYNHNVQFAQWIGKIAPPQNLNAQNRAGAAHEVIPCWFQEGQANAIGIPIAAKNLNSYIQGRDNSILRKINLNNPVKPSLSESTLTADAISNFLYSQDPKSCYNSSVNGDYQLGYNIGYAAAEALVAIGGPQSTMAMYSEAASGMTWAEAFQAVYGISWKDGSDILGKVIAAEYAAKPMDH